MERIRSVKPESCISETLARLSVEACLLFAYLPCFCDDEGRMKYNPSIIKAKVFPLRDHIDRHDCAQLIKELEGEGLVSVYPVEDFECLAITSFKEHQHPQKPKKSKFPPPPGETEGIPDTDDTETVGVSNMYGTDTVQATGEYGNNTACNSNSNSNSNKKRNVALESGKIISRLNQKAKTHFRPNTQKTQALIRARLSEGFTVEDFYAVIDVKVAEWLNNPKMRIYLRPETLFGSKFESYLNQRQEVSQHGENYTDMRVLRPGA